MKVNIETNSRSMKALLADIAGTQMRQTEASALNSTRTEVLKSVRQDMESALNVPGGYRRIFKRRFQNKRGRASARNLVTFGWVGTFKINYESLNKSPPGSSFEATLPNGHKGRFKRVRGSQVSGIRGSLGPTSAKAIAKGWKRERIKEAKIDISAAVNRKLARAIGSEEIAKFHNDKFTLGLAKRIKKQALKRGVEISQ